MKANRWKLNPGKMQILFGGSSLVLESGYTLMLNEVALTPEDRVRSFGVLLNQGMPRWSVVRSALLPA